MSSNKLGSRSSLSQVLDSKKGSQKSETNLDRSLANDIDYVEEKSSSITQEEEEENKYTIQISNSGSIDELGIEDENNNSLDLEMEVEESSNLMVVQDNQSKRKSISINGKIVPLDSDDQEKSFASNFEGIFGNKNFLNIDETGQLKQSASQTIRDSSSVDNNNANTEEKEEEYQPYTSYWMQCIEKCLDSVDGQFDKSILDQNDVGYYTFNKIYLGDIRYNNKLEDIERIILQLIVFKEKVELDVEEQCSLVEKKKNTIDENYKLI